jgi:hypothetical protein
MNFSGPPPSCSMRKTESSITLIRTGETHVQPNETGRRDGAAIKDSLQNAGKAAPPHTLRTPGPGESPQK